MVVQRNRVAVVGINRFTDEQIKFDSLKEAEKSGFSMSAISRCLSGHRDTHKNYFWKRQKDCS